MRVLLIHAKPLSSHGGAEITLRSHVEAAPLGTEVEVRQPNDAVDLSNYDAVVLGNLRPEGGMGTEAEAAPADLWTEKLQGYHGFALRSEHDIHPCALRDASCVSTPEFRRVPCSCVGRIPAAYTNLYQSCHAVRFLSPGHQRVLNTLIPIRVPQYVVAPPLDRTLFQTRIPWAERPRVALMTGDALRIAPDAPDRARSAGYTVEERPYLSVPHAEMPALLNRYQAVVVMPRMYHAFGRLAAEALACGCRILANDRVGAMTFEDPLQATERANEQFWKLLTDGVQSRRSPKDIHR